MNSIPVKLFSLENSDNFFWDTPHPAIIKFSFKIERFWKFFPSLITAPSKLSSEINTFEPAPKTNIFPLFLKVFKKFTKPVSDFALKKTFVFPPILNQFNFFKS